MAEIVNKNLKTPRSLLWMDWKRPLLPQNGLSTINDAFIGGRNTSRVPVRLGFTERGRGKMYHIIVYLDDGERKGVLD